jgi:simple sugar transport system permease protein
LTGLSPALESVLAGILGLLVGAVIMYIWGYDPWRAYWALLKGAYGGSYEWASSIARGTPLVFTALTFSICLRAGMFNIGAEGQLYLGAVAAVAAALLKLPAGLHLIVALIFAGVAGAIWSLGPALLKLTRGVHEVISTIMFNWVARFLTFYIVAYVLVDPHQAQRTIAVPPTARFPVLMRGTDLSCSVFLALAFAAVVSGMPPTYAIISGLPQLMNIGFDGMAVAMVGRNHPVGILLAALFFGGLNAGGRVMQFYGANPVPLEMVRVVMGAIVFTMAVPELARLLPGLARSLRAAWAALAGARAKEEG